MSTLTLPLSGPHRLNLSSLLPPSSHLSSPSSITPRIFTKLTLSPKLHVLPSSYRLQYSDDDDEFLEEEPAIGDCLVFEDGIFDDPYLKPEEEQEDDVQLSIQTHRRNIRKKVPEVEPQNLVPDDWQRAVDEINITKKERRKIAQEFEYGLRLDRKKKAALPLRVNLEEYLKYRDDKLSQLKPVVLQNPDFGERRGEDDDDDETSSGSGGARVEPKNPRWAVYGRSLEDISDFFNAPYYQPADTASNSEGRRKLFTNEEKALISAKIPNIAAATSGKWLPLHTLAATGEFYLCNMLLKHDVAINDVDHDGLTALHKAIICKKQAIMNFLLRESANPFVRDKDGATLMHYAVRTASSDAIKTLLLYNVDINLQDNDGWTPLHLAVQGKRTDVVRLLLIKGADKSLKNKDGLTPLEMCLYSGQDMSTYQLIKLLKQLPRPRQSLY